MPDLTLAGTRLWRGGMVNVKDTRQRTQLCLT